MPGKYDDPPVIPALKAELRDPWSKTSHTSKFGVWLKDPGLKEYSRRKIEEDSLAYTKKRQKHKQIKQDKNIKSRQSQHLIKICTIISGRKLEKQLYTWKVLTTSLLLTSNSYQQVTDISTAFFFKSHYKLLTIQGAGENEDGDFHKSFAGTLDKGLRSVVLLSSLSNLNRIISISTPIHLFI